MAHPFGGDMDEKQTDTEVVIPEDQETQEVSDTEETQAEDPTVVSIFKNLTLERFKEKPKIVPSSFEEIQKKNEEIRKKVEEKRKKDNKNVLRSYRLK